MVYKSAEFSQKKHDELLDVKAPFFLWGGNDDGGFCRWILLL
ncbi:MAG: hypothetical protein WBP08_11295 [Saprospiraceae bacterium]